MRDETLLHHDRSRALLCVYEQAAARHAVRVAADAEDVDQVPSKWIRRIVNTVLDAIMQTPFDRASFQEAMIKTAVLAVGAAEWVERNSGG
jgi:hypothetical protein